MQGLRASPPFEPSADLLLPSMLTLDRAGDREAVEGAGVSAMSELSCILSGEVAHRLDTSPGSGVAQTELREGLNISPGSGLTHGKSAQSIWLFILRLRDED